MLVTVIICTYNRFESLKDTLNSLILNRGIDISCYEVIVVDNNSNDKTKETVENYFSEFSGNLKYVFEPKQGLSYARNRGIREAQGDILAFTDDDVIIASDWLSAIMKEFKDHPDTDIVLGDVYLPEGDKVYTKNNILRGNGLNMAFRKDVFSEIGEFNTYLGAGAIGYSAEDGEFIYRAKKRGKIINICNEIRVTHKHRIDEKQRIQFLIRDCKGGMIFWLKYVLREMDLFALKKIYWFISGIFKDLVEAIKSHDRDKTKLNYHLLLGSLAGLIKGLYIWLFFEPMKSLCKKSA